jgi:hypothetical protein
MRPGMRFKAEYCKRLNAAEQTKMKELAAQKRTQRAQTTVHLNNTSTETTVATPCPHIATTPSSSPSPDIRQLLSNYTSRDPNPSPLVLMEVHTHLTTVTVHTMSIRQSENLGEPSLMVVKMEA